ncbi:hypothetical protein [Cellulomonas flavigena]|uniref:hypothetical protein n=1 Tax=Cellulomonas flavigena TaxID=1711 RepID=UPI000307077C|nr:hypothetical protein [Cellulomonas flavigena]
MLQIDLAALHTILAVNVRRRRGRGLTPARPAGGDRVHHHADVVDDAAARRSD